MSLNHFRVWDPISPQTFCLFGRLYGWSHDLVNAMYISHITGSIFQCHNAIAVSLVEACYIITFKNDVSTL